MTKLPKFLWVFLAMAVFAPHPATAQYQNEMGIYTEDMSSNAMVESYSQQPVYLIVTNPYSISEDHPVENILGYECQIIIDGPVLVTDLLWPLGATNFGDMFNQQVVFDSLPVVNNEVLVCTIQTIYMGSEGETATFTLRPLENPTVEGKLAVFEGSGSVIQSYIPIDTVSGHWDDPVFAFNADPQVVATEDMNFDNIKAMYR